MKTTRIFVLAIVLGLLMTAMTGYAQTAELTIMVKGIKEAKGNIMIAAGSMENPQAMITAMAAVTGTEDIVCVLQDVPIGKVNLYVFQDLNGNFQLDKDESQIPIEPCYQKEKLTIKEGGNKIEIKLVNIKEMMRN